MKNADKQLVTTMEKWQELFLIDWLHLKISSVEMMLHMYTQILACDKDNNLFSLDIIFTMPGPNKIFQQ